MRPFSVLRPIRVAVPIGNVLALVISATPSGHRRKLQPWSQGTLSRPISCRGGSIGGWRLALRPDRWAMQGLVSRRMKAKARQR